MERENGDLESLLRRQFRFNSFQHKENVRLRNDRNISQRNRVIHREGTQRNTEKAEDSGRTS
jgi:hypothetical protein